jgi:hypothetical protein
MINYKKKMRDERLDALPFKKGDRKSERTFIFCSDPTYVETHKDKRVYPNPHEKNANLECWPITPDCTKDCIENYPPGWRKCQGGIFPSWAPDSGGTASSSSSCPTPKRDQIEIQFGRENEVLRSRTLPKSSCTLRGIFDPIYTMKKRTYFV